MPRAGVNKKAGTIPNQLHQFSVDSIKQAAFYKGFDDPPMGFVFARLELPQHLLLQHEEPRTA
jgi:hypothetical protein